MQKYEEVLQLIVGDSTEKIQKIAFLLKDMKKMPYDLPKFLNSGPAKT